MTGAALGAILTVLALGQEGGPVGFDMRSCYDCEVLTLEGATSAMILAAGIGCAVAIVRSFVRRRETYRYRGISLNLR
jgi:hypothetical protein